MSNSQLDVVIDINHEDNDACESAEKQTCNDPEESYDYDCYICWENTTHESLAQSQSLLSSPPLPPPHYGPRMLSTHKLSQNMSYEMDGHLQNVSLLSK